jgi:peptidoglycan/xylan/chitin deacetylase (PgdA/CDA1 family)
VIFSKPGYEIGSHGDGHQMISRGDENTFRKDIKRAKSILEDQIGVNIKCYRRRVIRLPTLAIGSPGTAGFRIRFEYFRCASRFL